LLDYEQRNDRAAEEVEPAELFGVGQVARQQHAVDDPLDRERPDQVEHRGDQGQGKDGQQRAAVGPEQADLLAEVLSTLLLVLRSGCAFGRSTVGARQCGRGVGLPVAPLAPELSLALPGRDRLFHRWFAE